MPFEDGSSIQLWDDDARCEDEIRRFSAVRRRRLARLFAPSRRGSATPCGRPAEATSGSARPPTLEEIDERLGGDNEARHMLFEWSMVDCVENYFQDERLQMAYLGQGVIGTNASPHDRGTASIHFHHQSGRLGGSPGMWGYVKGGMGMVSFILCDIAARPGRRGRHRACRWPGSSPARGSSSRGASGSRPAM